MDPTEEDIDRWCRELGIDLPDVEDDEDDAGPLNEQDWWWV